jgi:hypothetical protein
VRQSYRYPPKPIDRPEHISVLMPTRGRPDGLASVFESFRDTVEHKQLFDVWLYVDDDDVLTLDYIKSEAWKSYGLAINWHVAKRSISMGDMLNQLWQHCSTNPGFYFPFPDDYIVTTQRWDTVLRQAARSFDDGVMLGFLPDNTARPHQVTFAIPSAGWLNLLGYFLTNRFFYWFDDQWVDEIAQMVGRKVMIPIRLETPGGRGKTPRMRKVPFWAGYFSLTLEDRYQDAIAILAAMCFGDERAFGVAREQALVAAGRLVNIYNNIGEEIYANTELIYRDFSVETVPTKLVSYLATELSAVDDLLVKLAECCKRNAYPEIIDLADCLARASLQAPGMAFLKAGALAALGCAAEAGASLDACQAAGGDVFDIQSLRTKLQSGAVGSGRSFYAGRSELRMPSWLAIPEPRDILFPTEIPQELFFAIQRVLYQDEIATILDVGAGEGAGSTRALATTLDDRDRSIYCVEPDAAKCELISQRYGGRVQVYCGSSVTLDQYMDESELTAFYREQASILNYYPLDTVLGWRRDELADLKASGTAVSRIEEIRRIHGITHFDMAILDGSMFAGRADLAAVYGARYLVINHVRSAKNCTNMLRLYADPRYQMVELNHKTGCGYAVFRRNQEVRQ